MNEEEPTYGKYGMLRKQFLKEYRSARYQYLVMTGELTGHLNQVDWDAREQVETLVKQMAEKQGVTEQLKMQEQMKWVGLMNNIKTCAQERNCVERERVYISRKGGRKAALWQSKNRVLGWNMIECKRQIQKINTLRG